MNNKATYLSIVDSSVAGNSVQAIKNKWNTLPDGSFLISIYCGAIDTAIIEKIENGRYGGAIIFGYGGNITYLYKNIDNWSSRYI